MPPWWKRPRLLHARWHRKPMNWHRWSVVSGSRQALAAHPARRVRQPAGRWHGHARSPAPRAISHSVPSRMTMTGASSNRLNLIRGQPQTITNIDRMGGSLARAGPHFHGSGAGGRSTPQHVTNRGFSAGRKRIPHVARFLSFVNIASVQGMIWPARLGASTVSRGQNGSSPFGAQS